MIAELGHFSLILALIAALIQGFLPLAGTALGVRSWVNVARPAVFANAVFCTFAFCCLAWCFYTSDFSVMNVANNSNSMLPWFYRLSATWGSHEGSILFWTLLLALWGLAVAVCSRRLPQDVMARVIGVMGLISVGLTLFMLLTSDPFIRLFPAAHEGRDLNPLLQDPGMVFHPPLLYMGYVGMVVPFAFAVAALIGGRLDAAWARWTRPWTSAAWIFLTLGISLGSYWSYYELGWGGWWFWDPVENASFMPWLTATALLHSLAVTEKRGCFKIWTVLLALITFSLIATPAEGLSGRFVALDRKKYGVIKGVTDREYYTNSFHVPVYFPIKAFRKIELEAPYHSFTNAGHITYVELDGDTCKNLEAFETIIRFMHDKGVGYGSINHPLDRDPVCGYVGVINGQCPRCGRKEGEAVSQETLKMLRRKYPHMPNCCR